MLIQEIYGRCVLMAYIIICAWMDYREQSIDIRVFILMGMCEAVWCIGAVGFRSDIDVLSVIGGMMLGILLYVVSRLTRGSIGDGDAIFFGITGLALGGINNLIFFGLTIVATSVWALGYSAYGFIHKISIRHRTMPLIPFAVPAGIIVLAMI